MNERKEFIFGVQYYRAPTPSCDDWESDLANIKAAGFSDVKFWVQWRWTHRAEDSFYFDDIDELMDLAYKNGLRVTLNVIFDVAPGWILKKYPESKILLANGRTVEPHAEGHRQIGGFPGTCYSHKKALEARKQFLKKTVERYKDHPALYMWDVWNEPEQCGTYRYAKADELSCFCDNCREDFIVWLKTKYKTIEKLNEVWGRCYDDFGDIELPTERFTFADFMDFREFNLDKMTAEGLWRLRLTKSIDSEHPVYLHVVPNTSSIFNALTGVDDFALAKECDVFASTNFAKPIWSVLTTSAGYGKTCYNVECHIGSGNTKMHQKQITLNDMVKDLVPQMGMGIKGFMFWQYRPEVLGHEAPAWGVTKPDGSMGSVGIAAEEFISRLRPYTDEIMKADAPKWEIAVWKGRKNEILSFCINNELQSFAKSIEAYVNAVYYGNYNCRIVDDKTVESGLDGIKLLIMPCCYEADERLIGAVDSFVKRGGTLLCEAHLGGYNADNGRHSYTMPGCGADELWGIHEVYTTSSYHLKSIVNGETADTSGFVDDVKKAIDAYGLNGGKNFAIKTNIGITLTGAERFACLDGDGAEVIGTFNGEPCIVKKEYGKGTIYYCGTNLGEGAENGSEAFSEFVSYIAKSAGAEKNPYSAGYGVHTDRITDNIIAVNNAAETDAVIELDGKFTSLFGSAPKDGTYVIPAESADILIKE